MQLNIKIVFNKKFITVYLGDSVFFKQPYIKGKSKNYMFLYIVFILSRFGYININNY